MIDYNKYTITGRQDTSPTQTLCKAVSKIKKTSLSKTVSKRKKKTKLTPENRKFLKQIGILK